MYSYMYMCSCEGKIQCFSVVERGDYQRSKLDCLLPNLATYYREVASEVSLWKAQQTVSMVLNL